MHLFAAIVPPREVVEEVAAAVRAVPHAPEAPPEPRRGLLRRSSPRGQHVEGRPARDETPNRQLEELAVDDMLIPVSHFGNVTLGDSVKLADALRAQTATWPSPHVEVAGGTALEFPGDESVWVTLGGEVDDLMTIGRGVPLLVQRLGHFVDRRQFRPWLSVGTITPETTAPYLEAVVAAIDDLRGVSWTVDSVVLMSRSPDSGSTLRSEVVERMRLG